MDAELKAKWVKALRSGEFKQGKGCLKEGERYCCLGVLARVAGLQITEGEGIKGAKGYTPLAELVTGAPTEDCEILTRLWRMNDTLGKSFPEIADYIEREL
jgi:hypothetical protein